MVSGNSVDNTPDDPSINRDSDRVRDEVIKSRDSIKELKEEISQLDKKLRDSDINNILPKWDSQMTKVIRDLKAGKPTLISILSHLK